MLHIVWHWGIGDQEFGSARAYCVTRDSRDTSRFACMYSLIVDARMQYAPECGST